MSIETIPPTTTTFRNLRACLVCSLIKTMEQFEHDGCDNCDAYLRMKSNRDNVYDCTSSNFDGSFRARNVCHLCVRRVATQCDPGHAKPRDCLSPERHEYQMMMTLLLYRFLCACMPVYLCLSSSTCSEMKIHIRSCLVSVRVLDFIPVRELCVCGSLVCANVSPLSFSSPSFSGSTVSYFVAKRGDPICVLVAKGVSTVVEAAMVCMCGMTGAVKRGGCGWTVPQRWFSMSRMARKTAKVLTLDSMNPSIKTMEYAVRGPLVIRAVEIEKELQAGAKKPFATVIRANIGDAHAMGQKPITFLRQVVAGCVNPAVLHSAPADVKDRVKRILDGCKGRSVGSYSDSPGLEVIRRDVADYIRARDGGIESNWEDVMLCGGASDGIRAVLKLFNVVQDGKKPGVMIPIPQYPLYSASIAEFDMEPINYYMNESNKWGLDVAELKRAVDKARQTCNPKAIVVINPGNPTGQVLTRSNIEDIVRFARDERLVLFADEVYQDNVYAAEDQFHSFKKVMMELGAPYSGLELASFMSSSKGYMGECGLRGGYAEIVNFDDDVRAMFLKSISAKLCPTVLGQATMDVVVNPPRAGEPSFELYAAEKKAVLSSLAQRAHMVADTFNSMPGVSCNPIEIPPKAVSAAEKLGQSADFFYCMHLLEKTGICVIPGSGFGQVPGTYHFRSVYESDDDSAAAPAAGLYARTNEGVSRRLYESIQLVSFTREEEGGGGNHWVDQRRKR
ncbi:unnamed protein product [Notodromas monacha]|uniref:alanine transaminase n=1 Tax=Notodromas monacha TaxID=399045 RepID=A0A7R9BFS1_9CRUS|nr:unnamed protein product [Notodromas monacha]CAG0913679.1 unnamed protein product [Notodromas monacha]